MVRKGLGLSVYERPSGGPDILFEADYLHVPNNSTCKNCDRAKIVNRPSRKFEGPVIHYGLIASGDRVMKSATKRNKATHNLGDILCFEMEAAGIATEFSCIVIRGISDYADSHKNEVSGGMVIVSSASGRGRSLPDSLVEMASVDVLYHRALKK
ncbi:hypothetical protein F5882DRAFT_410215 [Hyaloscypha sp. PMI_1271]|nr:hypothetical protein F5882DRAFT_410215 [Hyaloscypha sp. PMI_1271]